VAGMGLVTSPGGLSVVREIGILILELLFLVLEKVFDNFIRVVGTVLVDVFDLD